VFRVFISILAFGCALSCPAAAQNAPDPSSRLSASRLSESRSADKPADANYRVQGLSKPAEIIVDHWGVPHIYAQTHYDAFFVQGFRLAFGAGNVGVVICH